MNNPYFFLFKKIWKHAREYRSTMVVATVIISLANTLNLLEPYIFGQFINVLQQGGEDMLPRSLWYLSIFVGLTLLFWVINYPGSYLNSKVQYHIEKNFKEWYFDIVTALPVKWHKDNHSGETIDKFYRANSALSNFADNNGRYLWTIIRFFGSFIILVYVLSWLGFVSLVFCLLLIFVIIKFDTKVTKGIKENNKLNHKVASAIHDYITNIITVLTLRLKPLAQKEINRRIVRIWPVHRRVFFAEQTKWLLVSLLLTLMRFVLIALYLFQLVKTNQLILVGSIVMVYQYLQQIEDSFFNMAWQYGQIVRFKADYASIDGIVKAYNKVDKDLDKHDLPKDWQTVAVLNINFSYEYEKKQEQQIKDVSLLLKRGAKIALVGASGSGKSTLMSLLRGLYKPQSGSVWVDGKEIDGLATLKSKTSLIPQEPEIFENTILYNITAGISHHKKDVEQAVRLACFDDVVTRLPKGLNSKVNEKGVNLSGGEKQRLALARGLFTSKNSDIILLDESTSSVDVKNEMKIYQNLMFYYQEQCLIASIHKLHLIPFFNYIYVMDAGKVVEEGTLNDLLANKGEFALMWEEYQRNMKDNIDLK